MLCRKCKNPLDLSKAGMICNDCGYDNTLNIENLPDVDILTTMSFTPPPVYTCPKCKSTNVSISEPILKQKSTPYDPLSGLMGCLICCNPLGLLLGLTGRKKTAFESEKICNDCGTHFN